MLGSFQITWVTFAEYWWVFSPERRRFYDEDRESEDDAAHEVNENGHRCFARAYHIFNADQVDGFTVPEMPTLPEAQRIQRAEDFFRNTGIRIVEKGARACYDRGLQVTYTETSAGFIECPI
jgi:antirestriction protein ArdC